MERVIGKSKGGAIEGTKSIECGLHIFGVGDISVCSVAISVRHRVRHLFCIDDGMLLQRRVAATSVNSAQALVHPSQLCVPG